MRAMAMILYGALSLVLVQPSAASDREIRSMPVRALALLPEDFSHPESIAWHPGHQRLYVGSFVADDGRRKRQNHLLRLDRLGRPEARLSTGTHPLTGVAVDGDQVFYLDFSEASLKRLPALFDSGSRPQLVARFPKLRSPAPRAREIDNPDGSRDVVHFGSSGIPAVNGLAFDHRGDAFVSDSYQGAIFVVRGTATCVACTPELVVQHPLLATAGALPFGANGLAFDDDGRLFVNNAGDGRVLEIDVDTGAVRVFAEGLPGADGLIHHDGLLWVSANQSDAVIALDDRGRVVARAGGFHGLDADGAPIGMLFPAASVVVDERMVVANLALPITAATGDEWEESVTRWNLVEFDLPVDADSAAEVETSYLDLDGDRIAYRRLGQGRPLLLLNRLRGTLDTWDPLFLDLLGRRCTVITVDYPGIGYSTGLLPDDVGDVARFVDRFTRELGLEEFAVAGWSWGGLVAQAYVTDRPGRATHGVLIATNPPGHNEIPLQPRFLERAVKPVNDLADEEILFFEPASEASLRAARDSRARIHARPGVVERIPSTEAHLARYFTAARGFHLDRDGRREKLARTTTPILVIAGDNDPSTAGQNWFPLIGRIETARFLFLSRTGHAPQHQHPELAADAIHDFLDPGSAAGSAR